MNRNRGRAGRVKKGADLLDALRPGWWREVDTEELRMASCSACLLGQLYGDYLKGLAHCGGFRLRDLDRDGSVPQAAHSWAVAHGFARGGWEPYLGLADLWADEVARREAAGQEGQP